MQTIEWYELNNQEWLLDIALDHLTMGRAALCRSILEDLEIADIKSYIEGSVAGLRRASVQEFLVRGLLTRAWLQVLAGDGAGGQADLDEAWEIAARGPMRLHMADIHLYRARLFFREKEYPWESPAADLVAAEQLINDCGYHRRDEELADAKRAILSRSETDSP